MKNDDSLFDEIVGIGDRGGRKGSDRSDRGSADEAPRAHGRRAAVPLTPAGSTAAPEPAPRAGSGRRRGKRRRSRLRTLIPILLVLAVVLAAGAGGVAGYRWITGHVQVGEQPQASEFPGPGSGEALIQVKDGDTGGDIAASMKKAGVIKSTAPFTIQFANNPDASKIAPGTYRLKKQMTSEGALKLLLDPSSRAGRRLTVPEGQRMSAMFPKLSESTGIPVADFEAAAADYTSLGIPQNAANSAEGYLFPGTYDIPDDAGAKEVLTMMVQRMTAELDKRGVAPQDRERVLTLASIAEKEARNPDDYGKVVRTIDNRLAGVGEAGGHPMRLQLDSTIAYASGRNSISTTPKERATDGPYNTYMRDGLPVGPISNPGAATIDAALNPPEGPWLYWVAVNTDTGETKFAATKSEHDANVREWQAWARSKH